MPHYSANMGRAMPQSGIELRHLVARWATLLGTAAPVMLVMLFPPMAHSLDAIASQPDSQPLATTAASGDSFPGSAYFFAEDAFATAKPGNGGSSPHVLMIEDGPAPKPLAFLGATSMDRVRALNCLTTAIYYEAANEPDEGQRAVAQVVLNRVRHQAWPGSVCAVVYQGTERDDLHCQFTFTCNGAMARAPSREGWQRARRNAQRALAGEGFAPAGAATFYHTIAIRPEWSARMKPVAVIGAHIFYRLPGAAGGSVQLGQRYAGREPATGPGVYAFVAPSAPPVDLAMPVTTTIALPQLPIADPVVPAATAPVMHGESTPGLPQSSIRSDYVTSGRAIAQ